MKTRKAEIGILCWEAGHVPKGLVQLESLVGNSTNPDSYAFPVRFCRVKGANIETILENPSPAVLQTMIEEARAMAADGIRAITTSCGFNAVFQRELASALDVPVFTSSLLQVPFVQQIVGEKGEVAIITAHKAALKPGHLEAVGITKTKGLHVFGLENCPEWGKMFTDFDAELDLEAVKGEVVGVALEALHRHPGIRAYVLECTDLPPFSAEIREKTGLPVFDIITLAHAVYASL